MTTRRNHRRIEDVWLSYLTLVIPKGAPEGQVRECKRAFYAGAEALLTTVMGMLSPDAEPTPEDLKNMDDLHRELLRFAVDVKEGRA